MPVLTPGTIVPFYDVAPQSGNTIETRRVTVAASQTIRRGYPLVKTSGANTYQVALANPSAGGTTAQSGDLEVVGIALENITTNASGVDPDQGNKTTVLIAVYNQSAIHYFPIYNATAANAEPRDLTLGFAYEFVRYRSATESLGAFYISTVTTDGDNRYVQRYAGSDDADDYGVVGVIKDSIAV